MKRQRTLLMLIASILALTLWAQDDAAQRSRKFQPQLQGVWQKCSFTPSEDGQPQITLTSLIRVYSSDSDFQDIVVPTQGSSYIQKFSTYQLLSDSTYLETTRPMRHDSLAQDKEIEVKYRFSGQWLLIEYTAPNESKSTEELWMRVRPQARQGQHPQAQGAGEGRRFQGQRPNGQGQRRPSMRNRQQGQNPFEDGSSTAGNDEF